MATSFQNQDSGDKRERYHHGDLRAHLVETVRQLVEEKGVDGFSISEASRRAGVSSAAPYKHFADKGEIVRAVAFAGMQRLGESMRAYADAAPFEDFGKMSAIGKAYVRFAREEPGVFRLMFGLSEGHGKDEALIEQGHRTFGTVLEIVAAYLPPAAGEDEVRRRSYMLWTFVHGHAFLEIDGKLEDAQIQIDEDDMLADLSRRVLSG